MERIEEVKALITSMKAMRAFATVGFLQKHVEELTHDEIKLTLAVAAKPLRAGGGSHIFLSPEVLYLEQDLFEEDVCTLALKTNCQMKRYQCALLKPPRDAPEEITAKRLKTNTVSFDLRKLDFAVIQHKGNYFETVSSLDPVLKNLVDQTPEEHLEATVSYDLNVSFVHDDSYDSVIVPRLTSTEDGLRVHSAVLMAVRDLSFDETSGMFNNFSCRAI